jgi:hypothetical protein
MASVITSICNIDVQTTSICAVELVPFSLEFEFSICDLVVCTKIEVD